MGLASDLKAAVAAVNVTDKKLARLVGQHIEDTDAEKIDINSAFSDKNCSYWIPLRCPDSE